MYGEQVPRQREHGDRENHRSAPGAVRNELAAAVYGPVVQARDITGDIHLHRPASLPPPNQLPPAPRLVGREAEFAQLDALSAAASGGPAVALVTGAVAQRFLQEEVEALEDDATAIESKEDAIARAIRDIRHRLDGLEAMLEER